DENYGMHLGEDSLTATNVPLKLLIEFAYDVKDELIFGLSGPVSDARFDVTAKVIAPGGGAPPKLSDAQLAAMIIPLLADRFHLKAHLEPKTLPVYDLIVAKGGPKLKLTDKPVIGSWNISGENTDKVLTIESASMADLAAILSDQANRQVIDKTGLTGVSDVTLKWSDDVAATQGGPDVISIFTAIEEQLGLKLQPSKGPVDTLVIDHAEMPTAD
ncbi:MAG TPA: TIGR03435 family protein, partial [Acidobacteriaceae bacterium]